MLAEKDGLHSLALRDRYLFMPLPLVTPYDEAPTGFVFPDDLYVPLAAGAPADAVRVLRRDRAGHWRRDLLPAPDLLPHMHEVARFNKKWGQRHPTPAASGKETELQSNFGIR